MNRQQRDAELRESLARRKRTARIALVAFLTLGVFFSIPRMLQGQYGLDVVGISSALSLFALAMLRGSGRVQVRNGAIELRLWSGPGWILLGPSILWVGLAALGLLGVIELVAAQAWLLVGLAAVFLLLGGVFLVRPLAVVVDPDGIRRGTIGAKAGIGWDQMDRIAPPSVPSSMDAELFVEFGENAFTSTKVPTRFLAHPMWVPIEWLEHYRDHPEDRGELTSQAGVDRLERIHAELRDPSVEPQWFPPPRSA